MDSKDTVFSKGTNKPGRYGSLGNTDLASIKKMLAEDLSDEPVDDALPEKNVADAVEKPSEKPRAESSNDEGHHTTNLLESQEPLSKVEEGGHTKELQRLNVEVDATLHSQFKAMVGMRKTTMRQVVESFMQRYVEEVKKEFF